MKTNRLLVVILILQGLTLAGQWLEGPSVLPTAQGQAFNSAADRQEMIEQMKMTNSKLDRLVSVLESGNLQVKVVPADEPKNGAKSR